MKWWYLPIAMIILIIALFFGLRIWLTNNLEGILNSNPERQYQITYEKVSLNRLWDGFSLDKLAIEPMDTMGTTQVTGRVRIAEVDGVSWLDLVMGRALDINKITFIEPNFLIVLREDTVKTKRDPAKQLQQLFGDILSRGKIEDFELRVGQVRMKYSNEEPVFFELNGFSLFADNIRTDSVMWRHVVPFLLDDLTIQWTMLDYHPDANLHLTSGAMIYNLVSSKLRLRNVKMEIPEGWVNLSKKTGIQKDIFEFEFKLLTFHGLLLEDDTSTIKAFNASKLEIDGLNLHDYRDKNQPRPEEPEKPFFTGMINKIPIPIEIDTIQLSNASISYSEMPEGKEKAGTLSFADFFATGYNVTNIPDRQAEAGGIKINVDAKVNGAGPVQAKLDVPYDNKDQFTFHAVVDSMPLDILNVTLHNMAGITVRSGVLKKVDFYMNALNPTSENKLEFDYEDLKIEVLNKEDKKSGTTWVANTMLRTHNTPDMKSYRVSSYTATRNMFRGPFNFLWNSLKEGLMEIAPSGTAKVLMGSGNKGKQENKEKRKKK